MISQLKQLFSKISGASKGFDIEHQIFNVTCFVILLFGIQAGILNYIIGLHYMTVILAIPGCIIALIIYLISIKTKKLENTLLITFVVATYLVLMPLHFFNGGSHGTVFFLLIMLINMFILIGKVKQIFFFCLSLTAAILSLVFIEMTFPEFVVPYKDDNQRFSDFITVLIYTILFTAYIFWMYKRNHEEARKKIISQNHILEESKKEIEAKNEKIEALLMEMHHRIKNNLQIVSSLISMQLNRLDNENPKKALIDSKNRLDLMALLHQQLQIDENQTSINLKDFVKNICLSLTSVYQLDKNSIELKYNFKSNFIEFEKANSIGLILNELITNSIKYAEPKDAVLKMEINLYCEKYLEQEFLFFTFSDNGSNKINLLEKRQDSLGLKLIETLVKQLNSELKIEVEKGNLFTLKIPL